MPREIIHRYDTQLLRKRNVVGVGTGYKSGQSGAVREAVTVLVETKVPAWQLKASDMVPPELDGVVTDVIEVGFLEAPRRPVKLDIVKRFRNPMPPGCSIGHLKVTAGTFGFVAKRQGRTVVVSNNHVLANSNKAKKGELDGDYAVQPGPYDGGKWPEDSVGQLWDFVPISMTMTDASCAAARFAVWFLNMLSDAIGSNVQVPPPCRMQAHHNYVDAAVLLPSVEVTDEILEIGTPDGMGDARLGQRVQKTGRTTGHRWGKVVTVDTTVNVSYGPGKVAMFRDQVVAEGEAGHMSQGGDSGSAVLTEARELVGLLFAGSDKVTIFNPICEVAAALDLELP